MTKHFCDLCGRESENLRDISIQVNANGGGDKSISFYGYSPLNALLYGSSSNTEDEGEEYKKEKDDKKLSRSININSKVCRQCALKTIVVFGGYLEKMQKEIK